MLAKFAHQMGYSDGLFGDMTQARGSDIGFVTREQRVHNRKRQVPLLQSAASGRRGVLPAWLFHRNRDEPSGHTSSKHIGMCCDVA